MFIDASALVAILLSEPEAEGLSTRMSDYPQISTSPLAVWETVVAVARERRLSIAEAETTIRKYLDTADISIIPMQPETSRLALDAFDRFGKGRHPAR